MPPFDAVEYQDETFQNLRIQESRIDGRTFSGCTFNRCHLGDNEFEGCTFHQCTFTGCDLSLSRVNNCTFNGAVFSGSRLLGINWTDARWSRGRILPPFSFEGCSLNHSVFTGLSLPRLQVLACSAVEVDFTEADLHEADFRRTDLLRSRFYHTNLTRADFRGAHNYTIAAADNVITSARFSLPEATSLLYSLGIELEDQDESGANLEPGA